MCGWDGSRSENVLAQIITTCPAALQTVCCPTACGWNGGTITKLLVTKGSRIWCGDDLVVADNESMSAPIPSMHDGLIVEWIVSIGDWVESESPLLRYVPTNASKMKGDA